MMAPSNIDHSRISTNLSCALHQALENSDCVVLGCGLLVRLEQASISTYPDGLVICGPPSHYEGRDNIVDNPALLFEVLSPSTEADDRGEKFDAYRQLPSLREYLLVHYAKPDIECFRRRPDDSWQLEEVVGLKSLLSLKSIGAEILLEDVYRGVEF